MRVLNIYVADAKWLTTAYAVINEVINCQNWEEVKAINNLVINEMTTSFSENDGVKTMNVSFDNDGIKQIRFQVVENY